MGEVQPRAVMTPEAQVVLEQRIVAWKKAGFDTAEPFFDVKTSVVTEMLTELKVRHGWSKDVLLDGPHVFRHSMAVETFEKAIGSVMDRGGWTSVAAAKNYGVNGVSGRDEARTGRR